MRKVQGVWKSLLSCYTDFFSRECCGNNAYGRSHDEFLIDKQKAYVESPESFDRNLAVHSDIAVVSNCGDILTQKSENGLELNDIKWIGVKVVGKG